MRLTKRLRINQRFIIISQEVFNSEEFKNLNAKSKPLELSGEVFVALYDIIRKLGCNYKMSEAEFISKITSHKKLHFKCGEECTHYELFYKKMIV